MSTQPIEKVELSPAPDGTWTVWVKRPDPDPDHRMCNGTGKCHHSVYKAESLGHLTLWEAADAAGKLQ